MATTTFVLKEPKAKETLIYLIVRFRDQRIKYSMKEKINPALWNNSYGKWVRKNHPRYAELNNYFEFITKEIKKFCYDSLSKKEIITKEIIKEELDKLTSKVTLSERSFFDYYDEFVENSKTVKKGRTIQKYNTLKNQLLLIQKKLKCKMNFDLFDLNFEDKLNKFYLHDQNHTNNTKAKYIAILKAFLNWATDRGYNSNLMFKKYKTTQKDADIIYLTRQELKKFHEYDFSDNIKLEKVRDVFCFACFTGLRYSDIAQLNRNHYIKDNKILLKSAKTTDTLVIPLVPPAIEILKKYNYSLPVISNVKTNLYLKDAAKIAGIEDEVVKTKYKGAIPIKIIKKKHEFLSFHDARRTFVTLSLEKGGRAEMVMAITGHKNYSTFKKYISIAEASKKKEMELLWTNI